MAKEPVAYDASVIQKFAERLYSQAASIIITSAFLGIIVGAVVGAGGAAAANAADTVGMAAIIGAVVGGLFGFLYGKERAFKLKLEAQVALCQVLIEKNTSVKRS
jgi:positive regulator of sigma E activity